MSQLAIEQLELRYKNFYSSLTEHQRHDTEFLFLKSGELELIDIPLAYRIMQRIKTLSSEPKVLIQIETLVEKMTELHSELMQTSSTENSEGNTTSPALSQRIKAHANTLKEMDIKRKLRSKTVILTIPFLIFAFYQFIWATERFESQLKIIVKEPDSMATLDPTMALMSGFGVTPTNEDIELVKAFIFSNDMLKYLKDDLDIVAHYKNDKVDYFSRLSEDASREEQLEFYSKTLTVVIDASSGVVSVFVQAFNPKMANDIAASIVHRSEWFINEIGHNLAKAQLVFIQKEHEVTEKRLQRAKNSLLQFQREYNLLDPQAEGMAFQQITYELEGQIAAKEAQLRAARNSMSEKAPTVMNIDAELDSLIKQLDMQRQRLIQTSGTKLMNDGNEPKFAVGDILANFTDYKVDMEFALQAYSSSKISMEKSRIEAYRQIKYLVVVESPTLPEEAKYPESIYNITLFLVVQLMLFGIVKVIMATVNELK
jgi:capsular polysaccharide transport system permease protein